jgi:hypothetical protein
MNGAGDAEGPGTMSRQLSYGRGVQSNALLVLAGQGPIDCRTFPFANVGDNSEHSANSATSAMWRCPTPPVSGRQ